MTYDGAAVSWTSSCVPCRGRRIAFSCLVLECVVPRPILLSINFFGPIRPIQVSHSLSSVAMQSGIFGIGRGVVMIILLLSP